jgi:hypothetical protein
VLCVSKEQTVCAHAATPVQNPALPRVTRIHAPRGPPACA